MKILYESDKDSDDVKSTLGLAALAAGIAIAAKKIYDRKFRDEKTLKKYGIETDQTREADTEEALGKQGLIYPVQDELIQKKAEQS